MGNRLEKDLYGTETGMKPNFVLSGVSTEQLILIFSWHPNYV